MGSTRRRRLKSGFTTGTAAAAATKAALTGILGKNPPESVRVEFLSEGHVIIPVHWFEKTGKLQASCSVIKDAGDDPDVTHGAEIGATVQWAPANSCKNDAATVNIRGGKGVGRVTKPGLEVPPGKAAINSGPRKMIRKSVNQVLERHRLCGSVDVEIFVPDGETLARNTLNARLGILGGISILGTTGIVRPLSHDAYEATIHASLSVAGATGLSRVVLTTGRRSERFAMSLLPGIPPEGFVQIGDFFRASIEMASEAGMKEVILTVFFGKAVKMAMGVPHTHAAKAVLSLDSLAAWAFEATGSERLRKAILSANTARHAFDIIYGRYHAVIEAVGRRMVVSAGRFMNSKSAVRGIIFDYSGQVCFDSESRLKTG